MSYGLNLKQASAGDLQVDGLDLVSLGALVHRLGPGHRALPESH